MSQLKTYMGKVQPGQDSGTDEPTDRLTWERYSLDRTAGQMSQLTDLHGKGTALTG
ncbi:hypothetical protein DPMN_024872 [Dreissena polymorpha]|uniref:Uncharacterized protein n=1 Tax=Dreissena polymorpha TaxID=45954 RepID=A0A9D4LQL0_DREPO|nr:hypothetical protein DPMN_024872 [Dreissena polymorpha]